MTNYSKQLLRNSPKMDILVSIISHSLETNDKIIVFSLSTTTLTLIEYYIQTKLNLIKGWTYLRKIMTPIQFLRTIVKLVFLGIDGATTTTKRTSMLSEFNINTSIKLMIVSTKASSLGLNLVAANRVVIFEPSWNPCDDQQASSRIFRFGQEKPTFVYRLIIDNSFELSILNRQTNKQNMSDRVIDELLPNNKFTLRKLRLFEKIENDSAKQFNFSDYKNDHTDYVIRNVIEKNCNILSKPPTTYT